MFEYIIYLVTTISKFINLCTQYHQVTQLSDK